jgi:hypothetical protein
MTRVILSASILASALSAFGASAPYADAVRGDGALAYYRFNDSTNRSNVHLNLGSAGQAGNATNTWNVKAFPGALPGDRDPAQFFDTGNSFAMIPYQAALNPDNTKPFTLEAWFYPASDQISSGQCPMNNRLAVSGADRTGWVIFQRAPDSSYDGKSGFEGVGWNFRMYRGSGGSSGLDIVSQTPFRVGEWTHVVVVYDPIDPVTNASLTIYINGVAANTNVWTGGSSGSDPGYVANSPEADVALSLGAYNNTSGAGGNAYFGGIDEFALYSAKLTPEVILSHYQNGTNGLRSTPYETLVMASSPVAYLRLNEPTPGPKTAINLGDVRASGKGTHTAEVRQPADGAVSAQANDGSIAYHNRNGNSVTTLPYLAENNPAAGVPFTFEVWLKPMRDAQGGQCPINNRWVGGTGRTGWVIFQRNPNLTYPNSEGHGWGFRMFTGNGNGGQDVLTEADYEVGKWGHLVVTWEPQVSNGDPAGNGNEQWEGILTAYFNGVPVASNTAALYAANRAETETGAPPADLGIGAYNAASGLGSNPFEGQIDELAIYNNYVLTPDQILAHYLAGTNKFSGTNYETLVLNAANDGSAQRLMPKTYLRFNEPAFQPAANSGSLAGAADANLVVANNDIPGPAQAMFGTSNTALALDGVKGWASLNYPDALEVAGQITLEAWIKPTATQGTTARVISHGPPVLSSFLEPDGTSRAETNAAPTVAAEVALSLTENGANYAVGAYDGTNFFGVTAPVPAGDLGGNDWVHLVGTFDGVAWKLFRNGQQLASAASSIGALSVDLGGWAIGSTGNGWADPFAGGVDEVAIYGKALTPAQIQAHFSGNLQSPTLEIQRTSNGIIIIQWQTGTLQHADSPQGPYTNVPNNPQSPYQVPSGANQKYYRLVL